MSNKLWAFQGNWNPIEYQVIRPTRHRISRWILYCFYADCLR